MKNELEKGLYSPEYEKDACGVGLVVNINGSKYHDIIEKGLAVLEIWPIEGRKELIPRRETAPASWSRYRMSSFCSTVSLFPKKDVTE